MHVGQDALLSLAGGKGGSMLLGRREEVGQVVVRLSMTIAWVK